MSYWKNRARVGVHVDCVLGRQLYPSWLCWVIKCEALPTVRNAKQKDTVGAHLVTDFV